MFITLVVYLLHDTKQNFTADVVKDLLEMDRLYCNSDSRHPIEWSTTELGWLSLVRPIQIFAPLVTFI